VKVCFNQSAITNYSSDCSILPAR